MLETAQKEQDMDKLERLCSETKALVDENGWHHNVCQADESALHMYHMC